MTASAEALVRRLAEAEGFEQAAEILRATRVPLDAVLCETLARTASQASREGDPDARIWQRVYELIQEYRYRFRKTEFFSPPDTRPFVETMADAPSGELMMAAARPLLPGLDANHAGALRAYRELTEAPDPETTRRLAVLAAYLTRELGLVLLHNPPSRYLEVIAELYSAFQHRAMLDVMAKYQAEIDLPFAYTLVGLIDDLRRAGQLDPAFVYFVEGLAMHLVRAEPPAAGSAAVAARLYRYLETLYDPQRQAPAYAQTLENLAEASLKTGQNAEAARRLEERLSLPVDAPERRHALVTSLGQIYVQAADAGGGAELYRRASRLYREQGLARLDEGRPEWLEIAYLLAESVVSNPARTLDELDEAQKLLERCDAAWRDEGHPQHAAVLDLLGAVLLERPGDRSAHVEEAISYLERATAAFETGDYSPRDRAIVHNRLGNAYRLRLAGDPRQNRHSAAHCFRAAAETCPPAEDRAEHLRSLHNLVLVLTSSERLEEVREGLRLIDSCLEHDTVPAAPLEHARDLLAKANLHLRADALGAAGEREAARRALETALAVPAVGNDPVLLAALQATLGGLLLDEPEPPAEAGERLRRAVEAAEAVGHQDILASARLALGRFCQRAGETGQALDHYRAAIAAVEAELDPESSEEHQIHVERSAGAAYEALVGLLVAVDRPLEALDYLERNKARSLGRRIAGREATPSAGVPGELVESYRALRDRRRHLETRSRMLRFARRPAAQELAETRRRMPEIQHVVSVAEVEVMTNQAQIEKLEPRLAAVVGEIREHDPGFDPRPGWTPLTAKEVAEELAPGRALLELVVAEDSLHLFAATLDGDGELALRVFSPTGADRSSLAELVQEHWLEPYHRYREAELEERPEARTLRAAWRSAVEEIGTRLGALLAFEAVTRHLSALGVEEVVFVPYQLLHLLPLHLLPAPGGGFLCDELRVSYAPSLRILGHCRRRGGRGRTRALVVDNPDGSLVFSGLEVELIEPFLGERELLSGEAARWDPVVSGMAGAELLHFSGHGYFDPASPLASALVLADRRLTLGELLASADLPVSSLVVLSACETGQVSALLSADEYAGLPAGFLDAGAPTVVGSLWVVEDSSGPLFMQALYRGLVAEGLEPGEAFAQAARALRTVTAADVLESLDPPQDGADPALLRLLAYCRTRKDKTQPLFDHPVHWAAYTLVGASRTGGKRAGR